MTSAADGKAQLLLSAGPTAQSGTFPVIVTGSANGHSHSQAVVLNVSRAQETEETQTWEYKLITAASEQNVLDQANKLGADGWEMVSVVRLAGTPAWRAFFKRAVKD